MGNGSLVTKVWKTAGLVQLLGFWFSGHLQVLSQHQHAPTWNLNHTVQDDLLRCVLFNIDMDRPSTVLKHIKRHHVATHVAPWTLFLGCTAKVPGGEVPLKGELGGGHKSMDQTSVSQVNPKRLLCGLPPQQENHTKGFDMNRAHVCRIILIKRLTESDLAPARPTIPKGKNLQEMIGKNYWYSYHCIILYLHVYTTIQ